MADRPNVLIVDDERDLADLYAAWLADDYAVETAYDGETAIERVDESVDVVLLDRRMPGMSGDEVLQKVRAEFPECAIAMITAVDPDFDILEMGFDAYITKPVEESQLGDVIDRLLRRSEYTETLREFFMRLSQREALLAELPKSELESDERFQSLEAEIQELRAESESHMEELSGDDFEALFYRLDA
ncbi:response regulator [Halobellus rubicundus]|uniref:Response regulator n=1 Tax=Halobellus rubicundus TaxID=2996466 RepID=A0ABD5M7S4_9EURY